METRHSKPRSPSMSRFLQTCKCISFDDVALPSRIPHTPHDHDHDHSHGKLSRKTSVHRSISSFNSRSPSFDLPPPPPRIRLDSDESSIPRRFRSDSQRNTASLDLLPCRLQEEDSCDANMPANVNRIDGSGKDEEICKDGGGVMGEFGRRKQNVEDGGHRMCKDCSVRVLEGGKVASCCCCCCGCKEMAKVRVVQSNGDLSEDPWCKEGGSYGKDAPNLMMDNRIWDDCVLKEKFSYRICEDFYDSMLEIVTMKKIIDLSDLKKLLACYFLVNPPIHHDLIEEAFVNLLSHICLS